MVSSIATCWPTAASRPILPDARLPLEADGHCPNHYSNCHMLTAGCRWLFLGLGGVSESSELNAGEKD